jgi:hypothetical protein
MAGPRTSDSILSRRKALMDEAGLDQPQGCLKIVMEYVDESGRSKTMALPI